MRVQQTWAVGQGAFKDGEYQLVLGQGEDFALTQLRMLFFLQIWYTGGVTEGSR